MYVRVCVSFGMSFFVPNPLCSLTPVCCYCCVLTLLQLVPKNLTRGHKPAGHK